MENEIPKHLLVIRLSAMGDVAICVPVIAALKRDNPTLKITVLTRDFFRPFFREIEGIEFVSPDLKGRHRGLSGMFRLWKELRKKEFTHVADLHDVLRTKFLRRLLSLSGCRVEVIDKGRSEKRMLTRKFRKIMEQLPTSMQRYGETIARLGFSFSEPVPAVRKPLPVPSSIGRRSGTKQGKWIGVAPFAQHKGKIYPTLLTDELIGLLVSRFERVFLFGGGPYERDFAECMEVRHGERVISVIGRVSLSEEMDIMSNLDAIVTMDSASMHIASLMGVPVVSVWGATHPYAGFYGFGQDPRNAVQLDLPCRPCSVYGNRRCLFKDYRCLQGIAPQTIFDRVCSVTDTPPPSDRNS